MAQAPLYGDMFTQADVDAQYNPAHALPDPGSYMRHYVAQSAAARLAGPCALNVPYGATLAETLDILPAPSPSAPVFVFVHGGYWRALSAGDFSCMASGMRALGCTAVVVNYALAPFVTIDEITRQVRAAITWVYRNIDRHGGDPGRMAIAGHSAGAQLAAMSLLTRWRDDYGLPDDPFKAAVLVSGLYDLTPLRFSYLQPQIQLDCSVIQRNSPQFNIRSSPTPVMLTWGDEESSEFARQSRDFDEAWRQSGNASELLAQPDANHYSAIFGFEDQDSALCQWLMKRLSS